MTKLKKTYRLTISHDEGCESPLAEDTLFKIHSFSNRHINFTDPDRLLACEYEFPEGHEDEGFSCDEMPTLHDGDRVTDHEWMGPDGFMLSYFEHGLCRWGLEGTMSGMPDFRWDGTQFAGYLEVIAKGDDLEWWNSETDERKWEIAKGTVESYTEWVNGECYGYRLEEVSASECDLDFEHEDIQEVDSCFGFIGAGYFAEEIAGLLKSEGITEDQLEIVDEAYGASSYMDFFESQIERIEA